MAGPWERYQTTETGPWTKYAASTVPEDTEPTAVQSLNLGLAETLGAPVDVVNAGLGLVGLGSEEPFAGSESIRKGLEGWSKVFGIDSIVPPQGVEPETLTGRMARGTGQAAGGLAAFGPVAQGVRALQPAMRSLASAPVRGTAVELAAGASSGVGGYTAHGLAPDSETAEVMGELAGGLTVPGVIAGVSGATRAGANLPVVNAAIRTGRAMIPGVAARDRAARRLQELVPDPEAAAARLEEPTIADLTPAQQAGEKRLLALERLVLEEDAGLDAEYAERTAEGVTRLRGEMGDIGAGDPGDTRTLLEGRVRGAESRIEAQRGGRVSSAEAGRDRAVAGAERGQEAAVAGVESRQKRLSDALTLRIQQAEARAAQRLEALDPEQRPAEAARVVREEVERALAAGRMQESRLWGRVSDDIEVPTTNVRQAYAGLAGTLPRAQADDVPEVARRFLEPGNQAFRDVETVNEMRGLYSKLREESRKARAAGNYNTARIADGIADGILADFQAAGEVDEAFATARAFSRELNQRFTQGAVGRMLRSAREGGPRVAPEASLEATVGRGGVKGAVAAGQIETAAGEGVRAPIGQHILANFRNVAVRNGEVSPDAGRRWLADNADLLDAHPDIRGNVEAAIEAREAAVRARDVAKARLDRVESAAASAKKDAARTAKAAVKEAENAYREAVKSADATALGRQKALHAREHSAAAVYLQAEPGREIEAVIRSRAPGRAASRLVATARKDPTGNALKGLKASAVDYLIDFASRGAFTEAGEKALSGRALKAALRDDKTLAALSTILSPDEITRLHRVANELVKIEAAQGRLPAMKRVIDDLPNSVLDMTVRWLAARHGGAMGGSMGGSLQVANMMSGRARQLLLSLTRDKADALIREALRDRRLMQALLLRTSGGVKAVNARLNAWLSGPGRGFFEAMTDEEGE